MATTHSWHTGAKALGGAWPSIPGLLPDESLSSWIIRIALESGCDPLSFTAELWPDWRCWGADLDRGLPTSQSECLSQASGIDKTVLTEASLFTYEAIINKSPPLHGVWPWILAIGARNRSRTFGAQICPQCLDEDESPYLRIQWRFAWHTHCQKHQIYLLDACHTCGQKILPHLLSAEAKKISVCFNCAVQFNRQGKALINKTESLFQKLADEALRGRAMLFCKPATQSDWFTTTHFFVSFLYRVMRQRTEVLMSFCKNLGINLPNKKDFRRKRTIERMSVSERNLILTSVPRICDISELILLKALTDKGVTQQAFLGDKKVCPRPLSYIVEQLPLAKRTLHNKKTSKKSNKAIKPVPKKIVDARMKELLIETFGMSKSSDKE